MIRQPIQQLKPEGASVHSGLFNLLPPRGQLEVGARAQSPPLQEVSSCRGQYMGRNTITHASYLLPEYPTLEALGICTPERI